MNVNKMIKLIAAVCASLALPSAAFALSTSQLDRSYDKLGFAYSTFSDLAGMDADGLSINWGTTGGSENWASSVSFSYTYIDAGIIDADLLSTAYNLGYRVRLSDKAELVPLVGFSYHNLSSGGWAVADIWSFLYGVSARYALAENTIISASAIGQTGEYDSWVSEIDGLSTASLAYGISIEQFFNDVSSISLSYTEDHLGSKGVSIGVNMLL
jgi:hypothetical protein